MTAIRHLVQDLALNTSSNLTSVFGATMVLSVLAGFAGIVAILLGGPPDVLIWGVVGFVVSLIALVGCLVSVALTVGDVDDDR